jgi:hypothetical protein
MEKFFLQIDAVCVDDKSIDSQTEAHIECSGVVAVNVLVRFFEKEQTLRELFEGSLKVLRAKEEAEKISMN